MFPWSLLVRCHALPCTQPETLMPAGMLQPSRTWCFVGEIVHDQLSQMPVLGHRVEVRDASGAIHSIMFYPTGGSFNFLTVRDGWQLLLLVLYLDWVANPPAACVLARHDQACVTCVQLKAGHTIFIRYASRVFFSDLATEAIKVEDLK